MNNCPHQGKAAPYRSNERCAAISTTDPCQHAASLRGWSQDYLQLSAGRFSGEIVEASIGPLQVFKETIHQCVDEKANPRRDSYTVGVPIHVEESGYWVTVNSPAFFPPNTRLLTIAPSQPAIRGASDVEGRKPAREVDAA